MKEIKKPQAVVYILCATTHMYGIDLHTAVDYTLAYVQLQVQKLFYSQQK